MTGNAIEGYIVDRHVRGQRQRLSVEGVPCAVGDTITQRVRCRVNICRVSSNHKRYHNTACKVRKSTYCHH